MADEIYIETRKSPQQQIFDKIFELSLKLGYQTFDYLPASSTGLPFVFIGEQFNQDRLNKTARYGEVQQTIHIYGGQEQRKEVTTMANNLNTNVLATKRTDNFYINVLRSTGQTLFDNSTPTTMVHYILEIDLKFN